MRKDDNTQISISTTVHKRIKEIKKKTGFPVKVIVAKAVDLLCKQMEKENGNGKRDHTV